MEAVLQRKAQEIETRRGKIREEIASKSAILQELGVEAAALKAAPHLEQGLPAPLKVQIRDLSRELQELRGQLALDGARFEAIELHAERLKAGDKGPMRAHITVLIAPPR